VELPKPAPWDNRDIPLRFKVYGLNNFAAAVVKVAEEFLATPGPWWSLYLWGPTGSRKTSLAVAIMLRARHLYDSPRRVGRFVPAYQAVRVIRKVGDPDATKTVAGWRKTRLLLLDDLGKHRDTPHVQEQLLFLLHERYDWWEPVYRTIVTANMSLDELGERIDQATARRLREGRVLKLGIAATRPKETKP